MNNFNGIKQPVFIAGPERAGTTLLYSVLANADEFYWLSRVDSLLPSFPFLSHSLRTIFNLVDTDIHYAKYEGISSMYGVNTPSECIPYWKKIFGFGDEVEYHIKNDLFTEENISSNLRKSVVLDFKKRLKYSGKERLLFKQPGFSLKIKFWDELFEDALFLICVRNVANNIGSYEKVKKKSKEKFWGTKVPGWREHLNSSFKTQAAYQLFKIYEYLSNLYEHDPLKKRMMIVSYDKLIRRPEVITEEVLDFCKITWNEKIEESLEHVVLNSGDGYSVQGEVNLNQFKEEAKKSYLKYSQ